jgi:hypothetical protein
LSPETPRARVGDNKEVPIPPALTPGWRMLRTERLTTGIAGASTLCLVGEAADVYAMRLRHGYHSQAHHGFEAVRASRSIDSGPWGPSPGRPGHILRPACVGASTRRLAPGLGDQTGLWSIGEYCHRNPLARESVTIRRLSLPVVIPESQVSRTEMPTPGIAGASTRCLANGAARRSPPMARRSADVPGSLPAHQVLI